MFEYRWRFRGCLTTDVGSKNLLCSWRPEIYVPNLEQDVTSEMDALLVMPVAPPSVAAVVQVHSSSFFFITLTPRVESVYEPQIRSLLGTRSILKPSTSSCNCLTGPLLFKVDLIE